MHTRPQSLGRVIRNKQGLAATFGPDGRSLTLHREAGGTATIDAIGQGDSRV
ncbi:MAG: hypothetical protein KAX78_13485 [Phycisphaerae bacterium]|nr:hypothetical protein [Phycisphaerae bacterium]